ncbi:hypothetical protein ACFL5C_00870 [Candidatus Omnitrophota bacterium]
MKKLKAAVMTRTSLVAGLTLAVACMLLALHACTPSYPKEKLPEAVKSVCKAEYDMDVDVVLVGETMGMYYPMEGLLDMGLGINKDAWDDMSNLILVASRVALSTDADVRFYCVVTQDARLPELQVVIIKYVDDVKKGMYRNISRSESFKRTLFSINLTPQAQKERSVEKVFDKMGVDDATRQKVLDEFFRSPPTKLSDVGYWKGQFYLKNINMEEFFAAQMANRIKIEFRGEGKLEEMFDYKSAEGFFVSSEGSRFFLIKFKIADKGTAPGDAAEMRKKKVQEILDIASDVVYGYKYEDFDFLMLEDQLENVRLSVSAQDVYNFNKKKLSVEEIVQAPAGYFQ